MDEKKSKMRIISIILSLIILCGFYFPDTGIILCLTVISLHLLILLLENRNNNYMFLILLMLFTLGPAVNYLLNSSFSDLGVFKIESEALMIKSLYGFALFSISGYIFSEVSSHKAIQHSSQFTTSSIDRIQLLILGTIVVILIQSGVVMNVLSGDYNALVSKRNTDAYRYFYALLYWILPMISVLSYHASGGSRTVLVFGAGVIILNLLVGRRTEPLAMVLMFLILSKVKIGVLSAIVSGGIFILLFPVIGILRSNGFVEIGESSIFAVLLKRSLGELALTPQTLAGTIDLIESGIEDFRFGLDYLKGLIFAIPFGSSLFPEATEAIVSLSPSPMTAGNKMFTYHFGRDGANFQQWVREGTVTGLGYSIVAEAYLQFGVVGIICIGGIAQRIWQRCLKLITRNTASSFSAILVLMFMLTWIRNDSIGLYRSIIYGYIIYGAFKLLAKKK